jgi:hypothetical protein
LISRKLLIPGNEGRKTGRAPQIAKGVTPIHALPPKVSIIKGSGISGRSASTGNCQCINNNLPHDWYITGKVVGRSRIDKRSVISGDSFMAYCKL